MRVEKFDRLDVLRRERDEIARAAAQQIGGRQRVELAIEGVAHFCEQIIGHLVGLPRLPPVQQTGERRDDCEADQKRRERPIVLQRGHRQGAEDGDGYKGGDASDARRDDDAQPLPQRPNEFEQSERRTPPGHIFDAQYGIGWSVVEQGRQRLGLGVDQSVLALVLR